ncbi:MAG TPA: nitric-oxide reductase large subunit [Candidatus Competibacteraceae bacterium]|nr:nitric-oxide reductase large subunit [Candidatus Competibacteraceae bacterium]
MQYKKLWIALTLVVLVSFAVLGGVGFKIMAAAPPIPSQVVTIGGLTLFDGAAIQRGQGVWQSSGGQEVGSIWGHGAYVAPDWTADWLHREAMFILDTWARQSGAKDYASLPPERQAALQTRLQSIMRTNTYDPASGRITLDPVRAAAFSTLADYYADVFTRGRDEYAIPRGALADPDKLRDLNAFFWWTSWVASTDRPGDTITYTNNWPHEPLVGNTVTGSAVVWSVVSFVLLLAGIGGMVWYFAAQQRPAEHSELPRRDPLLGLQPTPSQQATVKFFLVTAALVVLQIGLGAIVAHYGVEGSGFYGIPLDQWLPYSVARTWHTQLGIFWIATSWLATGLYMAPAVSGYEPKSQRLGVDILFIALLIVVFGSLAGEWLSIKQKLGAAWFWFGTQGYEYVDLGRFWQILLFIGLVFWLWLLWRALRPALSVQNESRPLLLLFLIASIAIPLFYAAGLMYGQHSHLVTAEYWRWWVVHLWVEGFFEVFATVVIAFLFTRLKLLSLPTASKAVLFSTVIFLFGGIIGTFHHLYFTGTPQVVIALGATFSALEVVPLVLIGFEAWENVRLAQAQGWLSAYRWPINFFVAVAFWNFVGAGLFGFFINPPVALYFMQGLNTTPVHAHTALFGVYGMLGIGLMLFCLRGLWPGRAWKSWPLATAFWCINIGLALMVLLSLLPIGLLQTWASVEYGTWYARSAEFLQTNLMNQLRWLRTIGDTIFAVGALLLGWFVLGLVTGHSYDERGTVAPGEAAIRPSTGTS